MHDGSAHTSVASALALAGLILTSAFAAFAYSDDFTALASDAPERTSSSPPPARGSVWTVFTTVDATVRDNYATVRVIADIGNRGPDPEFPFRVTVPDDAFVTGLTIERDGEVHEARIEERAAAREEYEDVKRREATGGLVEKERHSSTYAFLVNTAEFESVRATLTYERYLAADEGAFDLDLVAPVSGFGEDTGARFDVTVRHADGVTGAWASHEDARVEQLEEGGYRITRDVGPRRSDEGTPFTASYTLAATGDSGSVVSAVTDGEGAFAHRFRAPPDARELPLDLVLVLDVSGSMSGLKMQQLQDAAVQVVGMLEEMDRVHLVLFSSDASSPWNGMEPATSARKQEAARLVREAFAGGGTNFQAAIREGFAAYDADARSVSAALSESTPCRPVSAECERLPLLVFLTDGQASTGETDRSRLRDMARDANAHGANVFALAFGHDADSAFITGLAEDGNGTAIRVPDGQGAEVDLARFMTALTTPVLKDVRVEYDTPGVTAYRSTAPILFAGSELLVVGTFPASADALTGRVHATTPNGTREYGFDEATGEDAKSWLPRLVAYHEIRHLQRLITADGEQPEWVDRVTALAVQHGFVTDYTSLVLSLPERPRSDALADDRCAECMRTVAESSAGEPRADRSSADTAGDAASGGVTTRQSSRSSGSDGGDGGARETAEPGAAGAGVPAPGLLAMVAALAGVAALARRRRAP